MPNFVQTPAEVRIAEEAVLQAWALSEIVTHTPRPDDDRGYTCDERGCMVCNCGLDCLADMAEHLGGVRFDYNEAADALDNLAEWLRGMA